MAVYLLESEVSFQSFAEKVGAITKEGPLTSAISKLQEVAMKEGLHPVTNHADPSLVPWNIVDMRHLISMLANTYVPSSGSSKKPCQLRVSIISYVMPIFFKF